MFGGGGVSGIGGVLGGGGVFGGGGVLGIGGVFGGKVGLMGRLVWKSINTPWPSEMTSEWNSIRE